MNPYTSNECITRFFQQCICDKENTKYIVNKYRFKVIACGRRLLECCSGWTYYIPTEQDRDEPDEFLDFIDGNGFIITKRRKRCYAISPIRKDD